jgi:hypothetical protein
MVTNATTPEKDAAKLAWLDASGAHSRAREMHMEPAYVAHLAALEDTAKRAYYKLLGLAPDTPNAEPPATRGGDTIVKLTAHTNEKLTKQLAIARGELVTEIARRSENRVLIATGYMSGSRDHTGTQSSHAREQFLREVIAGLEYLETEARYCEIRAEIVSRETGGSNIRVSHSAHDDRTLYAMQHDIEARNPGIAARYNAEHAQVKPKAAPVVPWGIAERLKVGVK